MVFAENLGRCKALKILKLSSAIHFMIYDDDSLLNKIFLLSGDLWEIRQKRIFVVLFTPFEQI